MKKSYELLCFALRRWKNLVCAMKLTISLLLFSVFSVSAGSIYSQNIRFDLKMQDATLIDVFREIERTSDFGFFFKNEEIDVNVRVSVDVKNASLEETLGKILKEDFDYRILNNNIIVTRAVKGVAQQQKTVTGTVTDDTGESLPGVAVVIKGTSKGTITDFDGNFSISGVSAETVLSFSFVGMIGQEQQVGDQTTINITMQNDAIGIEEVVAIGYGTTSKRKMVGAISTMTTEKLEQVPFANVSQALQGQVPGLIVQSSGGALGEAPTVSIRGAGKPLYVIDGVMIDEGDDFSFTSLNMDDIESISFLKDASSTAVYGSRAGNGIILVNTKRGKEGKMKLNYSFNYQLSQPTVLQDHNSTYEYALIQNQASLYDGVAPFYTDEQLNTIKNGTDPILYPNNEWYDLALNSVAPEQRHNISINGGSENTNYFVSLGYFDQEGILKSGATNLQRYNLRSNVNTKFKEIGLELGFNVNASLQDHREPSQGEWSVWNNISRTEPNYTAYNPDGTYAGGVNHLLVLADSESGYDKEQQKFVNTQITAKWKVPGVEGLSLGMMGNYRTGDFYDKNWNYLTPQYNRDGSVYPVSKPALTIISRHDAKLDFEASASYSRTFEKHGFDATFVYTRNEAKGDSIALSRREYLSSSVDQIFAGPAEGKDNFGIGYTSASEGYVGRFKYDYASRYIVEFSFRYDGNDNFAPDVRWGFFPAISGAWVASDEAFMKSLNEKNIVNNLKFRASYGQTGISDGAIRHGYLSVYNLVPNVYSINNSLVTGFSEGPLVDPASLTWYTRNSQNYGLNFSSLNNQLEGSFDYFYYRTTGFLMSPENQYTTPLGKDLPQISSNSAQRRAGFEFALRYKKKLNDLYFEIGANYGRFNQLWEQLDSEDEVTLMNPYIRETHETDFWGNVYVSDGLFQGSDEYLNSARPLSSTETQAGDIKYVDSNGDGKIDEQDKRRIGLPTLPHATYGFDFSANYKGWFMNGLVQGTGDRFVTLGQGYQKAEATDKVFVFQQDYWTPENPNATFSRVSHTEPNGGNNTLDSDFLIRNAKYIRLKSLQVGYDLKRKILKNQKFIASCKVVLSGTNLLTFSGVLDYFDPEDKMEQTRYVNAFSGTGHYPIQKTYSIGINVGF